MTMNSTLKIPRSYYIFAIFVLLFCGLFVTVELINHKLWTNDFLVYFEAVNDFFKGNDPYASNYGLDSGNFKYPPFTLYLFSFFTLVPYWLGQLFHLALLAFSLIISVPLLKKLAAKHFKIDQDKKYTWILYVTFFCVAIHLTREFHMGNVNLILLGLLVLGLNKVNHQNPLWTAIFWGLMTVLKPIMILAFIPLIFYKKWKVIAYLAGLGVFFFLFPVVHIGWTGNLQLWQEWLDALVQHGVDIESENSLKYLANHYFGIVSNWIPSLIFLLALITAMFFEIRKNGLNPQRLILWIIVFTAFTPNFFVTDTEHFLLSIPLLVFLLFFLSKYKSIGMWVFFFLAVIPFSLNSNDLWGRTISDYFDSLGALGIGNLVFITLLVIFCFKPARESIAEEK